jgi:hypothetical protein
MAKKKKKIKLIKTLEERCQEINIIKKQLSDFGLSEHFQSIKTFYEECDKYIKYGYSWTGSIKLHGLKRILEARLTTRKHLKCSITLKYDETV